MCKVKVKKMYSRTKSERPHAGRWLQVQLVSPWRSSADKANRKT